MVKRFKLELLPAKIFPGIHTTWPTTIREALYTSQNRHKITKIHHKPEISTEMDTYQVPTQIILLGRVVIGWFQRKMDYMVSFELAWNTVSALFEPRGSIFQNGFLTPDYHKKNA